jgi:hypothetical protein
MDMARAANILIIILELLGFRVSIGERKWKIFAYYTQISNLITVSFRKTYMKQKTLPVTQCLLPVVFLVINELYLYVGD